MPLEPSRTAPSQIRGAVIVIAIAVLLTLMAHLFSANEYVSVFGDEMAGAYDCDGPAIVLTLGVAGIVAALLGIVWSLRALRRSRTRAARAALGLALIVVVVASVRIAPAIGEMRRNTETDSPCH